MFYLGGPVWAPWARLTLLYLRLKRRVSNCARLLAWWAARQGAARLKAGN